MSKEFSPDMDFESVAEAVELINKQISSLDAAFATVRANINNGEYGFAKELMTVYIEKLEVMPVARATSTLESVKKTPKKKNDLGM